MTADVTVAISGDINPATVGQSVTYTVDVSNPASVAATGVKAHVTLPERRRSFLWVGVTELAGR